MYLAGPAGPSRGRSRAHKTRDEPPRSLLEKSLALKAGVVAPYRRRPRAHRLALDDALAELRGVLLQEHERRVREGILQLRARAQRFERHKVGYS
jgi:hypothetical protein